MIKIFKNLYFDTKKSMINLWEQINGEDMHTEIDWVPYVYVPSPDGEIETIYGEKVVKKEFKTYLEYHKFMEVNGEDRTVYENDLRPETQFLAERYHKIKDEDIQVPSLTIYYIDIEVLPKEGFPDTAKPEDPIILASVRNSKTGKTVTFGYDAINLRNYKGEKENVKYIHCTSEGQLIKRFLAYIHKFPCDVISGYNIWDFDLPYIINRTKTIFGKEKGTRLYNKLSPINVVTVWDQKSSEDKLNIDISGMTILDYIDVYKQYGKKLERYSLEYVSQTELGVGKLKHGYKDLKEFCELDWDKFVDYNVIDCERVDDLERKLGYIRLIQSLSLLSKTQMRYYNTQTKLIEGAMITYYRRNGLCAPHFFGGSQEPFEAAIVKDPDNKKMHEWVVDIDITSSYPSHIIALNMSNETFFGRITGLKEYEVVNHVRNKNFKAFRMLKEKDGEWESVNIDGKQLKVFNLALKKGKLAVAPCGSVFKTSPTGVVAQVERNVFEKRKEVKGIRNKLNKEASELSEGKEKDKKLERAREMDSFQGALKIFLNAFFGIMSVPYSRYFNTSIAEGITSCGRWTIKQGEKFCNDVLNNPNQKLAEILDEVNANKIPKEKKDFVKYIDTDSLFVALGEWLEDHGAYTNDFSDEQMIELIKRISRNMEEYIDDHIFNETQLIDYNSQVHDFKIAFKQEIIAKTSLFVKKKKYAYWLVDDEGISTDEIKVKGLEMVRSDSSEAIRPRLKHILEMIMKQNPDDKIWEMVEKYKNELRKFDPEDLAANIGVKNIKKYLGTGRPIKGTPWHVKGVHNYRLLLNQLELKNRYEDIHEGIKSKVIYTKKNPYGIDTITFHDWPEEFNSVVQLDREKMIEKFFVKKIRFLLKPINKEALLQENRNKMELFF